MSDENFIKVRKMTMYTFDLSSARINISYPFSIRVVTSKRHSTAHQFFITWDVQFNSHLIEYTGNFSLYDVLSYVRCYACLKEANSPPAK